MELACRIWTGIFGLWLMGVSVWILVKPMSALSVLRHMGSTAPIHFTELGLRLLTGLAMIGLAPFSEHAKILQLCGVFLAFTALIIMPIPHRLHHRYALWWADKMPPWVLRLMAPISFAAGLWCVWVVLG